CTVLANPALPTVTMLVAGPPALAGARLPSGNCCAGSHVAPVLAPMPSAMHLHQVRPGKGSSPAPHTAHPAVHTDCGRASLPASATTDTRLLFLVAARPLPPATLPQSTVPAESLKVCSR